MMPVRALSNMPRRALRCLPRPSGLLRRRSAFIAALLVTSGCVSVGGQVWAIAERMAADPAGQTAAIRAADAEFRHVIGARMAALPGTDPKSDAPLAAPAEPQLATSMRAPALSLTEDAGLALAHMSYAPIRAGSLKFPDGAVRTAWIDPVDTPPAADETSDGMGRSASIPADRQPPSTQWMRLNRPAPKKVEVEPKPEPDTKGWRFIPASILPGFSGNRLTVTAPEDETPAPTVTADGRTVTTILFNPDALALDRRACTALDGIAAALRTNLRPLTLTAFVGPDGAAAPTEALHRAWAVRAYLATRGIDPERIRITHIPSRGTADAPETALRVDVAYAAG